MQKSPWLTGLARSRGHQSAAMAIAGKLPAMDAVTAAVSAERIMKKLSGQRKTGGQHENNAEQNRAIGDYRS